MAMSATDHALSVVLQVVSNKTIVLRAVSTAFACLPPPVLLQRARSLVPRLGATPWPTIAALLRSASTARLLSVLSDDDFVSIGERAQIIYEAEPHVGLVYETVCFTESLEEILAHHRDVESMKRILRMVAQVMTRMAPALREHGRQFLNDALTFEELEDPVDEVPPRYRFHCYLIEAVSEFADGDAHFDETFVEDLCDEWYECIRYVKVFEAKQQQLRLALREVGYDSDEAETLMDDEYEVCQHYLRCHSNLSAIQVAQCVREEDMVADL